MRRSSAVFLVFAFVVAPAGTVVVIMALLLFGAAPRLVFAPGHALKAALAAAGIHAPNAVGVIATVAAWWLVFVVAALAWDRRKTHRT